MSMTPGASTRPSASTVRLAGSSVAPTATMRPSRTPTSPANSAAPVPSTIRALRMSRSNMTSSCLLQCCGDCVFDGGPGEERGVPACVEAHRIREHEVAQVAVGEELVLDHLVDLAEQVGHHRDVPVRDVGAEYGVEAGAEGVGLGVERDDRHRVVG